MENGLFSMNRINEIQHIVEEKGKWAAGSFDKKKFSYIDNKTRPTHGRPAIRVYQTRTNVNQRKERK